MENKEKSRVGVGGYVALIIAVLVFSGIFKDNPGPLRVLDINTWVGQFGSIVEGAAPGIMGKGGSGVRNGFFQSLTIAPSIFMSVTFITIIEHYKGLDAARYLLTPLLRPFMGFSGGAALSMVSNWQSSDTGAAVARGALDAGAITPKERDILMCSEFVGAALIGMMFSNGALLFPYLTVAPGVLLAICFLMKVLAANLMRAYIYFFEEKQGKAAGAKGGE